jgi:Family of unknown function (DUF6459)
MSTSVALPSPSKIAIPRRVNGLEEVFGRQPSHTVDLPDPAPLVRNLAVGVVLALLGEQRPEQFGRWVLPGVFEQVLRQYTRVAQRHNRMKVKPRRVPVSLGTTRVCAAGDGVVEASAVVHVGGRARAVALRLEGLDGRWFATSLTVL